MNIKNISSKTKILNILRRIFQIRMLEIWLKEKTQGKCVNSFYGKLVPNHYQYSKGSLRKFCFNKVNYEVDISDFVGHFYYFGLLDDRLTNLLKLCKPDFTIFDIGTNIGFVALQFAKCVQPLGHVYGFEPLKQSYTKSIFNISLNNIKNITIINKAIGKSSGYISMEVRNDNNLGMTRVLQTEVDKIPITTLDEVVEQKKIVNLNIIKIDVEGFEYNVIEGGLKSIKQFRPILFVEVDNKLLANFGNSSFELLKIIENLKYKIFNASNMKAIDYASIEEHLDILCFPQEMEI